MRDGRRVPIRALLARLVVLGLLPVALLSAWAVVNTINSQREATERSVLELSRALASAVDSELEATRQTLAAMGRSESLLSGNVLIMLILGGIGRLSGAFLGATVFVVVSDRAAAIDPFNWLFVLGAMLILAVRFTPTGFTVMIDRLVARILPKART